MAYSITIKRQVDFHETDMAGIVHFSNFYRWMEIAETAFFQDIRIPIIQKKGAILTGWPKAHASCDFISPLRYQDLFEITLTVQEVRNHSLCFDILFAKMEGHKRIEVAKGKLITIFAHFSILNQKIEAALIEDQLREKIQGQAPCL